MTSRNWGAFSRERREDPENEVTIFYQPCCAMKNVFTLLQIHSPTTTILLKSDIVFPTCVAFPQSKNKHIQLVHSVEYIFLFK